MTTFSFDDDADVRGDITGDIANDDDSSDDDDGTGGGVKILAIMGRYFPYYPDIEGVGRIPFSSDDGTNCELVVRESSSARNDGDIDVFPDGGTGLSVWDGSMLLARYLEAMPELVRSKQVLELGSGPGVVGIASAVLGADRVVMTDLPYALALSRENAERNRSLWEKSRRITEEVKGSLPTRLRAVECRECDWFRPPPLRALFPPEDGEGEGPDVILVADCVWIASLVPPLLETVRRYVSVNAEDDGKSNENRDDGSVETDGGSRSSSGTTMTPPLVVFTYQQRGKDAHELFMHGIHDLFESVTNVNTMEVCGLDKPDVFYVFECRNPKGRSSWR